MNFFIMKKIAAAIIIILNFLLPSNSFGAMSSTHYTIYADAIDTGGNLSEGGIYSLQDTAGESPAGFSTSSLYEIRAGYQAMELGSLTIAISESSLNLGGLDSSVVNSASTTVTVSTDSSTGYILSIQSVSGSGLSAVTDGSVTAGAEEYGFSAQGTESIVSGDVAVQAGTAVASASAPKTGSETVLTFKASMSVSSVSGIYSQTIILSASANW